jgi:hypothetical protein
MLSYCNEAAEFLACHPALFVMGDERHMLELTLILSIYD